jgi:5'-nucleotidase
MNILITNDDGYDAAGLMAACRAAKPFGNVHIVAPVTQRSACSHKITLDEPMTVKQIEQEPFGRIFVVDGTPADCVRLANEELLSEKIDLLISGINAGANAGVDTFYSGTVAGAREGAIIGIRSIAISQAVRHPLEIDWDKAEEAARLILPQLLEEELPGPGFFSVNLPLPIPDNIIDNTRRVPVAVAPMPTNFTRRELSDGRGVEFRYGRGYWDRHVPGDTDYAIIRNGQIAIAAIPLVGRF